MMSPTKRHTLGTILMKPLNEEGFEQLLQLLVQHKQAEVKIEDDRPQLLLREST